MVRRSAPQKRIDDDAFPIRVKIRVPTLGFGGQLAQMQVWLQDHLGIGNFAHHSAATLTRHACAYYFRTTEDARAFLDAFPTLELADDTRASYYNAPGVVAGRVV